MASIKPPERETRFESRVVYEWRTQSALLRALFTATGVVLAGFMLFVAYRWSTESLPASSTGWVALAILQFGLTVAGPRLRASHQHLTVGRDGIRHKIPLGASWSLSWAEIRDIRLVFARTFLAHGWFYEIETIAGERKRIHPAEWQIVEEEDPLYPRPKLNEWVSSPWVGKEYVQHSLLHAMLGAPASTDGAASNPQPTVEDFLKTSRGKLVVALAIAGCVYAYLDWGQYGRYRFLHGSFETVLWSGVALSGLAGFLLMLGRSATEKAMAVIFMLVPGFFAPAPLALRINAMTDLDGPAVQAYVATPGGFAAADGHGRYLEMSLYSRFRNGDEPVEEQNLAIYHGVFGFDQLDLESIIWRE